jgi:hypothetical protein
MPSCDVLLLELHSPPPPLMLALWLPLLLVL